MKKTTLLRLLKFSLWIAGIALLLTIATGIAVRALVKQKDIEHFLSGVVKKQTGGQLTFQVEAFDVLREIRISHIQFNGPKTEIGFGEGGELSDEPLISMEQIKIDLAVRGLWRGALKVAAFLDKPSISLNLRKDQSNLRGLLAYRAKNFPKAESLTPWFELPTLPISLDKIFVPGSFQLTDFLVSDVSLKFVNDSIDVQLGPLDMSSFLKIYRKTIKGYLKLETDRTKLKFKTKDKEALWNMRLQNEFQIRSWTEYGLTSTNKISGSYLTQPLILNQSVQVKIAPDLTSFQLGDLKFDLGNYLKLGGDFYVQFPKHSLLNGTLRSNFQTNINLDNPITHILEKMMQLKTSGRIKGKLSIDGPFEISENKLPIQLPLSNITFQADQVQASLGKEINLRNLRSLGEIHITSTDKDIHISPKVSLSFADFSFESNNIQLNAREFESSLTSQATLFLKKLDSLKLALNLASISAKIDKKEIINENLKLNVEATSLEKLSNFFMSGTASMGHLVQSKFEIKCNSPCGKVDVGGSFIAQKLMPFVEILKNNVAKEAVKYLPSFLEGSVEGGLEAAFLVPSFDKKEFLPEDLAPTWKIHGDLKNLSLKVPFQAASLAGLNAGIKAEGTLLKGSISTGFHLENLGISPSATQSFQIEKVDFSAKTDVNLANLKIIKEKATTATSWQLKAKDIQASLPKEYSLSNHSVEGRLSTSGIKNVQLDIDKASIANGALDAKLQLSANLNAKDINSHFLVHIYPEKFETYVPGLKAGGMLSYQGNLDVKSFDRLSLTSFSKLEAIHLSYVQAGGNRFGIGSIEGRIPISFHENISDLKNWFQKSENKNLSDTIANYLKSESQVNEISMPESNLLSWRDAHPAQERNLKIYKAFINGVGIEEFEGGVEISSKAIMVKNFLGKVLGGRIQGSAFLPISPMPERILLTAHVKGIDSSQIPLLIGKKNSGGTSLPISGNFHLDFLVRNSQLDGVFDVTSIGAEQMNYMLEMVDPDHADSSINNIRRALKIGSLKKALVVIKRGEMSLDMDVRLVGAPIPLPNLNGIKVSNMIENIKADILEKKESL
ncbi:MAG: hypothetical protein WCI18_02530 [Pseudomonadota bacterium]